MHDKLDFLHCQLDSLRNRQILSGLLLQEGSSNRLVGGMLSPPRRRCSSDTSSALCYVV